MVISVLAIAWPCGIHAAETKPALKALFVTGGGYHDYAKLAPFLTDHLSQLINVTFDVKYDMDILKNENFADGYDVVVYDVCFDEADRLFSKTP